MENPESKSKWDDLVRELAVEIPPEVQQREEAVVAASSGSVMASRASLIGDSGHAPQKPQNPQTRVRWGVLWILWFLWTDVGG